VAGGKAGQTKSFSQGRGALGRWDLLGRGSQAGGLTEETKVEGDMGRGEAIGEGGVSLITGEVEGDAACETETVGEGKGAEELLKKGAG